MERISQLADLGQPNLETSLSSRKRVRNKTTSLEPSAKKQRLLNSDDDFPTDLFEIGQEQMTIPVTQEVVALPAAGSILPLQDGWAPNAIPIANPQPIGALKEEWESWLAD